jgi:hypothetical protein
LMPCRSCSTDLSKFWMVDCIGSFDFVIDGGSGLPILRALKNR